MSLRTDGTQLGQGAGSISPQILDWLEEIDKAHADQLVLGDLPEKPPPESEELADDEPDDLAEDYAEDAGVEFKPRAWRYLLGKAIRMAFLLGVASIIVRHVVIPASGYEPRPDDPLLSWPLHVVWFGSIAAGLFVMSYDRYRASLEQYVVRVSDTEVSGPPRWWSGRELASLHQTILLTHLDGARSRRRGPIDRTLGRQYLYSMSGERIYLQRWAFTRADLRRLLDLLGVA